MKPILHGLEQTDHQVVVKILAERVNVDGLICTFENNLSQIIPEDWLELYKKIAFIYKQLFTTGKISKEDLEKIDYETLEIAEENLVGEFEDFFKKPHPSNGRNYYYEFVRSFGVEEQASNLQEFLDEECDFI